MKLNVKNIDIEIRGHGPWYDYTILFHSDPGDERHEIVQYLYNEGFIQDRRTPYKILELG